MENGKSLVVFDVDGVLGNFEELRKDRDLAHIRTVAEKKEISFEEAKELFFETKKQLKTQGKFSTIETLTALGVSKEKFFETMNLLPVENKIILTPYAREVLKKLKENNFLVALTNTPHEANITTLRYLGLLEFFDDIYSIDKYNFVKPSTKIFEKILEDFGVELGYSVGDSVEKDLLPAKKLGFITVLFGRQEKPFEVDFTITDLRELLRIIN